MNVKLKNLDYLKRELEIEVSKEAVNEEFQRIFTEIQKGADIKGFRPGKAPLDLIKERYKKIAEEEVIKSLIPEYYKKAVEKENLQVASFPDIGNVKLDDKGLFFKATLEIRPEVKLKSYKGIKVSNPKVEVKESDIEIALENLRKHYSSAPSGQKPEENKELPKLDDDFAKKVGLKDLVDLKSKVKEQLLLQAGDHAEHEKRLQVMKHLLSDADFSVPQSWVKQQFERLVNNAKINLLMSGVKKEELDSKLKEKETEIQKQAQENVRLFFILDEIGKKEDIRVSEEELKQHISLLAQRQGISEKQMVEYLEKKGLWDDLIVDIRQEKVMDFLLKESKKD